MKLFVSGISSVETTLAVRGFPVTYYPVDYPFFGIHAEVAGSGFRVAGGNAALGDDVMLMTLVGDDDNGKRVREAIAGAGFYKDCVYGMLKSTVEAVILQEIPFGRRQVYCDLKDAQECSVDAEALRPLIAESDICALCNVNFSRGFVHIAKSLGKPVATDVQSLTDVNDPFNAEFIESADILFLSDEGASVSPGDFIAALSKRTDARIIVMGMGEDGLLYFERDRGVIRELKAVSVGNVITSGSGAALFSGFLHYYGKYECADALKRAEVFAALKLVRNAANGGFPTEADVENKLKETEF